MPKIPVQNQIIEVPEFVFLTFLRNWVKGCKIFGISCVSNHTAGLADFSGKLYQNTFEIIKHDSIILEPEIEGERCLVLFHELLDLIEKTWVYELGIIEEYAKILNLDISKESNRKKFQNKVRKYRFGDISKGVNVYVPESVLKIREQSIGLLPEIERIATDLDAEILKMNNDIL
jgi:hypothetical protein